MEYEIPTEVKIGTLPTTEVTAATRALSFAQQLAVTSPEELDLAATEVRLVKERWARLDDLRTSFVRPLNETVKRINQFFAVPLEALGKAELEIKRKMLAFTAEQERAAEEARTKARQEAERIRLEAERRSREALEKAEAEGRRKHEEEMRQRKLADEAAAREREARERGDAEARMKALRERKAAEDAERKARSQAEEAVLNGQRKAQMALESAANTPQPVIAEPAKAEGTSTRSTWSAEVHDLRALVKAVADDQVPLETLVADMKVLNRVAQALKNGMKYPGVRAIEKQGIAVSRR